MHGDEIMAVLHRAADAVEDVLEEWEDWSETGEAEGQHHADVAADRAARETLEKFGLAVMSEESLWGKGASTNRRYPAGGGLFVVVDPLDGSTNASRGVPWWGCSFCALDKTGPLAAMVVDLVRKVRWTATRGGGAYRDGVRLSASGGRDIEEAVCGVTGLPPLPTPWRQTRAMGAAALDLCLVAQGSLDAFVDCTGGTLAPWDYLGGVLICGEAGCAIGELYGRELAVLDPGERRAPFAAATEQLADRIRTAIAPRVPIARRG